MLLSSDFKQVTSATHLLAQLVIEVQQLADTKFAAGKHEKCFEPNYHLQDVELNIAE